MKRNINRRKIRNLSLALLIFISQGARAMERAETTEASQQAPKNNYETILREIEELTARIHREVNQVLADYKHDTEEYYRRMGVKRGAVTTMASLLSTTKISEESGRGRVRQERKETKAPTKQQKASQTKPRIHIKNKNTTTNK